MAPQPLNPTVIWERDREGDNGEEFATATSSDCRQATPNHPDRREGAGNDIFEEGSDPESPDDSDSESDAVSVDKEDAQMAKRAGG